MDPSIIQIAEKLVYENEFITIYDDDVRYADGENGRHVRIVESHGQPGVVVIARADERIALVRTYRYPRHSWEWGFPKGFAHHSDPVITATAELREELGREPDALTALGVIAPNSGLLASTVQVFIAEYRVPVSQPTDTREVAEIRWVTSNELSRLIRTGELVDGLTLASYALALASRILDLS